MPIYRPTCQVRIQLRLDEGADTGRLRAALRTGLPVDPLAQARATPENIDREAARNASEQAVLGRTRGIMSPEEKRKQRVTLSSEYRSIQMAESESANQPGALRAADPDERSVIFSMLPLAASVERNSVKEPDTCELTFDYRDLPFDPRIVRAAFISVTIGSVSGQDYMDGVISRTTRDSDGMLTSVIERRADEELRFVGSRTRFSGFVDEWGIEMTDDGDTVKLHCRDITALLIDQKLPAGLGIDLQLPLDEGIKKLLRNFPGIDGLQVFFGTPDQIELLRTTVGVFPPAPVPALSLPRAVRSRRGTKAKAQRAGDTEDNLWDHIITTAARLGYIAMVKGTALFIIEPRNLLSSVTRGRKMVFGRNLRRLQFARKLQGVTTQTVEVRSPNPDTGRTAWARYPVLDGEPTSGILGLPGSPQPTTSRAQKVSPTGQPEEHVQTLTVPRVADLSVLERVARTTYEEMARQEVEGSFETDDLDSFKEDPVDGRLFPEEDLLDLYPGDSVTLLYAGRSGAAKADLWEETEKTGDGGASSAQDLAAMTLPRRAQYLMGLGMSQQTAQRVARAAENTALADTFRVGTVNIDWDIDNGVGIEASFYNFITMREGE